MSLLYALLNDFETQ